MDNVEEMLKWVRARHEVWEARQAGLPQPWTNHPIVAAKKFTSVFRVLDYGTQFVLKDDFLKGDLRDVLMRCFLYRHTGRWEAWEYARHALGGPVTVDNLEDAREAFRTYRGYGTVRRPVFTSAYLVYPQNNAVKGTDKLESIFDLVKKLFTPGEEFDIVPDFIKANDQHARFSCFVRNRGVGNFMSMQILTDFGMSEHCPENREDDFVICGPGAERGAQWIWPDQKTEYTVKWAHETILNMEDCPMVEGRPPSLMNVQNVLCETSKLARYLQKPTPTSLYEPAHPGKMEKPLLPHWW